MWKGCGKGSLSISTFYGTLLRESMNDANAPGRDTCRFLSHVRRGRAGAGLVAGSSTRGPAGDRRRTRHGPVRMADRDAALPSIGKRFVGSPQHAAEPAHRAAGVFRP